MISNFFKKTIAVLLSISVIASTANNAFAFAKGIELHHIFPQAEEYRDNFQSVGIEPDLYTIPVPMSTHRGANGNGIHSHRFIVGGGNDYNGSWGMFFRLFPFPSKYSCFTYAALLLGEYGIESTDFYNYKTKAKTGEKFNPSRLGGIVRILKKIKVPEKLEKTLAKILPVATKFVSAAATTYYILEPVAKEVDDSFIEDRYLDLANDHLTEAVSFFTDERYVEMKDEISKMYFYIGYGAVSKIKQKTRGNVYSEIANFIDKSSLRRLLDTAETSLNDAVEIDPTNAFSHFYLGIAYCYDENYPAARASLRQCIEAAEADTNANGLIQKANEVLEIIKNK